MNSNDFISTDILLSDILPSVDDVELRNGISKGRYLALIQSCVEELAQDTFFDKRTIDVKLPQVSPISIAIPDNVFNVQYLYVWNGPCCSVSSSHKVYWKRNFNNKGGKGSAGYTADVKDDGSAGFDPFIPMFFPTFETIYYANIQEGKIMFSSSCAGFLNARIICNGFGGSIGDSLVIPRFFRTAITDYVRTKVYQELTAKEPRIYRVLLADAKQDLEKSWKKARIRISSMQTLEQNSLAEYYGRLNY